MAEVLDIPIVKPHIDSVLKEQLQAKANEQNQVIIHCSIKASSEDMVVRIWKSTFLYETNSSNKSELIHAENITIYPYWVPIAKGSSHQFTLYFTGLSKQCTSFNLIEQIPENGGFEKHNIQRNDTDIYFINFD